MDVFEIDLNLLRVLHAIAEEGGLTQAGARLGLSQPAVSYALGRLRTMFNDPLFVRSGNTMQATSTALEILAPVRQVMFSAQDALRHAERFIPAQSTRTFHIAMSDIGELMFLPVLCERLRHVAPGVRLEVAQMPVAQVNEALRNGRLDIAVGNLPTLRSSTSFIPLFHEAYVCMVGGAQDPSATTITIDDYLKLMHVAVVSKEHSHRLVEDYFLEKKIHRRVALQVPHFSAVPQILKRTGWAVTLPRRAARFFNDASEFSILELPIDVPEVEVTLHWHPDFEDSEPNRWLRRLVAELLAE